MSEKIPLIVILGPTATGKTLVAAHVAAILNGEVISADSRQVYRGMTLGTGKDYSDFTVGDRQVPCHLIDVADPGTEYNLFRYQQDFLYVLDDILGRGKFPILCGGTGLYIHAVLKGFDLPRAPENPHLREELALKSMGELREILLRLKVPHNTTDLNDRARLIRAIEIAETGNLPDDHGNQEKKELRSCERSLVFGIHFEREMIRKRITARLQNRLDSGLVDEVNSLLDSGLSPEKLEFYGLEYRYVTWFLTGKVTYSEMFEKLNTSIHQFAKRQMTWFRKMEREGVEIRWIDGMLPLDSKVRIICDRVKNR